MPPCSRYTRTLEGFFRNPTRRRRQDLACSTETYRICLGLRINDIHKELMSVISFGEAAFGDDLKELREEDIPIPEYLCRLEFVLHGPDVFEFHSW